MTRLAAAIVAAGMLALSGCSAAGGATSTPPSALPSSPPASPSSALPPTSPSPANGTTSRPASSAAAPSRTGATATARPAGAAPQSLRSYQVRTRTFRVTRDGRVIEVTAHYPATTRRGGFPVVLFSHGLTALPADYAGLATAWASRGTVVVLPRYPNTSRASASVQPVDLLNQPADASAVIDETLRLATLAADPFRDRVDARHVIAAGHSLGGMTTVGLLSGCCRDARLRGAIVLAGSDLGFSGYAGPAVPVLFLHGDADPVVPYSSGRSAYDAVPWPKAFVTFRGQGHTVPYTGTGGAGNAPGALVERIGAAFVTAVARNENPWALVRATVGSASGVTLESVPKG